MPLLFIAFSLLQISTQDEVVILDIPRSYETRHHFGDHRDTQLRFLLYGVYWILVAKKIYVPLPVGNNLVPLPTSSTKKVTLFQGNLEIATQIFYTSCEKDLTPDVVMFT
ncbi:uncharacterized protein LOC131163000 [Malania oleifera]|uniref:uncharacterized protein LOC131163000 n=1 Tax=Malania oleifera TaxID=397392 RepID=UPI0025AE3AB0|nr:uncharacterized protein LOC131163000 [Malania oleifera]